MNKMTVNEYQKLINDNLEKYIPKCGVGPEIVSEAMKYSLSIGGKRIRPILVLEFCRICGGDIFDAVPFAVAIEMIHTYSLIHDDLPCMDNDEMRRGMPSCHVKFGEEYALLAGDALLTAAFGVIADSDIAKKKPAVTLEAIKTLSELSGLRGMIGGQEIDLYNENKNAPLEVLEVLDSLKTGALIRCAAHLGVISACDNDEYKNAAHIYSKNIGLAFQIVDDILDVTGDEKQLGKPIGSDAQSGKSTYVSLLGLDKSRDYADKLTKEAVEALAVFGDEADFLTELAYTLIRRNN